MSRATQLKLARESCPAPPRRLRDGGILYRLLFGSDFPVTSPAKWADWVSSRRLPWPLRKLLRLPDFGAQERAAIMGGNARRLLGW